MQLTTLTDNQIKQVHNASMAILNRVGVIVPHEDMLSRLAEQGAIVDIDKQLVKIPESVIQWALDAATKKFTIFGRDLNNTAKFGQGKRNYNSSAGQAHWIETPGADRRFTSLQDVATATRLADALDNINIPGSMSDPHELPVQWRCVAVAAEMIRNTAKPITFWFHDRASAKFLNELTIAVRGSAEAAEKYPMFYPFLEPISPLRFPFHGIDLLYETSRLNLPVPIGPMAQMGMSAPSTIAATMAQQNAEILAGLVVTQCVREGTPVCYGGVCHSFDMRTTQLIFAGPEQAIFGSAMTQMGKSYGLPVYVNTGLVDSKLPDAQAGIEAGITLQLAAATGADIFGHMGICGVDQGASLDILVMQNEMISYIESTLRQIEFNDEKFAVDVIEQVGPGGNFISEEHTIDHFKQEMWFPKLLDRQFYDSWQNNGATDLAARCAEKKAQLLAEYESEPVNEALDVEMKRIVDAATTELGS